MIPAIRKVMVTTDFSDLGNGAIPHAYSVLANREGTVILCHILEPPALPNPLYAHYSPGGASSPEDRERLRKGLLQALEQLVPSEAREPGGVVTEVRVVETLAPVAEAICQEAKVLRRGHHRDGVPRPFRGGSTLPRLGGRTCIAIGRSAGPRRPKRVNVSCLEGWPQVSE